MPSRRRTRRLRRRLRRLRGGGIRVPVSPEENIAFPGDLRVILNDGTVAAGQLVSAAAATPEPQVSWTPATGTLYTLMCFDPDAPAASWLHWLVANIEGGTLGAGETHVPWAPPTPPPGTGTHRYFFCLFSHGARVVVPTPKERGYFKPAEFIAAAGLKPVVATFYKVRAAT